VLGGFTSNPSGEVRVRVTVHRSVLQWVTLCCSVFGGFASNLRGEVCVTVCYSVLQRVALCYNVLQPVERLY